VADTTTATSSSSSSREQGHVDKERASQEAEVALAEVGEAHEHGMPRNAGDEQKDANVRGRGGKHGQPKCLGRCLFLEPPCHMPPSWFLFVVSSGSTQANRNSFFVFCYFIGLFAISALFSF